MGPCQVNFAFQSVSEYVQLFPPLVVVSFSLCTSELREVLASQVQSEFQELNFASLLFNCLFY